MSTSNKLIGTGVDAAGGPVVDPTANVIALTEAANKRQDDLRVETNRRFDTEIAHNKELAAIREDHAAEIRNIETRRLDAIRQVDQLAVSTAAERSLAAIQTLAATTSTNADNLRNALTATAATIATQLSGIVQAINERIAALEKSSYEGKGKQALGDPQLVEMMAEIRRLQKAGDSGAGRSAGMNASWVFAIGAATLVATVIGIVSVVAAVIK